MERRTSFSKRIFSIMLSLLMVLSMMLYFPSGIFSNISFGLKASAEGTTNDFTLSAVTGDPKGNSNEEYTKLFDGNTGTKWCFNFSGSAYVIFKASEPAKFSTYSIATGNDTASNSGRNPVKWTLSACMNYTGDTTSWTVIDTVTDGGLPAANETYTDFTLAETTPFYQYFKLEVTELSGGDVLQISEIALKDYTLCEHQWEATGETFAPTCTENGYNVEYCPLCQGTRNVPTEDAALGHDFVDEVCTRCGLADTTPKEPSTDVNGVYQIGTAGELYWFADKVNNDNANYGSANAVLTADITVNQNVLNENGELNSGDFTSWTPIGYFNSTEDNAQYTGTFDGQNHTVSGLYFNNTSTNYVGLFGYLNKGNVSNVGIVDSYIRGNDYTGGMCGYNIGTITNCYNTGIVKGSNNIGGMCGYNSGSGTITNCYNTGAVSGTNRVGGVCGTNNGTTTNCYYLADTADENGGKTTVQFNSGEVAYLLSQGENGSVWGQTIGTENYPVLGGDKVYYGYVNCNEGEEKIYSNTALTDPRPDHNYPNGICTVCGKYEPAEQNSKGEYEIGNAGQLYWFADKVNNDNANYGSANAVLTADITVNTGNVANCGGTKADGWIDWTIIGNSSNKYTGTFDGQNYTISGLYFNNTSIDYVGLFGFVGSGGEISNVGVVDSYFKGNDYVGGVCGNTYSTITNCYNTGNVSGSNRVGGVCGESFCGKITNCYNTGAVSGSDKVGGVCGFGNGSTITNCYNTGEVTATGAAAYVGGVCGESGGKIINCYNTGKVDGSFVVGGVCGRNGGTITNCYFDSNKYSGNAVGYNNDTVSENVLGKTTVQFNSGEVAYLLSQGCTVGETIYDGSVWGQTIGTEDYPVLGGKKVLANVDQSAFANDIIVYGQSASLDGTIGLNIYVSADDSYEWNTTIGGVTGVKNKDGLYVFTYNVAAKDMDESINFTVNDKIDVTVSVSKYLDELSETDNESLKKLADSMSDYGDAAKAFFSNGTVAEQTITDDLSVYDFTVAMPEGISYYGSSLILESETTIRHYFKLEEGQNIANFAFTVDGESVEPVAKQGYYYIDIQNISAEMLGTAFSVSVNGEDVITNYSALSYVNKVLDSDSTDDNLKNLVKALYIYNQNALAYNPA